MHLQRSDLIGGVCAVAALAMIAWLSLDSWAITRCEELLASETADESPELAKCLARQTPPPEADN